MLIEPDLLLADDVAEWCRGRSIGDAVLRDLPTKKNHKPKT